LPSPLSFWFQRSANPVFRVYPGNASAGHLPRYCGAQMRIDVRVNSAFALLVPCIRSAISISRVGSYGQDILAASWFPSPETRKSPTACAWRCGLQPCFLLVD
jgi:hypothetical protein